MAQATTKPRVFGRRLAREMTAGEIDQASGAHGDSGSGTIADACASGSLTGAICHQDNGNEID